MRDFLFDGCNLPIQTRFVAAGVTCALRTNSEAVTSRFRRWPKADADGQATLRLDVLEETSAETGGGTDSVHFRGMANFVFALFGPEDRFLLDLERKRVMGVVSPERAGDDGFWNANLLPILLGTFGTTIGLVPVHCACLEYKGQAILIAGAAGAGKSTLAAALARDGFAYVSDDCTYVTWDESGLKAHGLGMPAKLLPDAKRFFAELENEPLGRSASGEVAFGTDVADVFGARVALWSRPRWVVFLERNDAAGCSFVRCDKADVRAFLEEGAERLPDELFDAVRQRSATITRLSELDAFRLRTGASPAETARAVAAFCEREAA